MSKIRRSRHRLIINMGIPIPGKDGVYIATGPRCSTGIPMRQNKTAENLGRLNTSTKSTLFIYVFIYLFQIYLHRVITLIDITVLPCCIRDIVPDDTAAIDK